MADSLAQFARTKASPQNYDPCGKRKVINTIQLISYSKTIYVYIQFIYIN